jgi:hypothetical protein
MTIAQQAIRTLDTVFLCLLHRDMAPHGGEGCDTSPKQAIDQFAHRALTRLVHPGAVVL